MSLKTWLENGWLRKHAATSQEINDLLQIVERDLQDARAGLSNDWQFGIAYNAALKICTILLHAEGYRSERNLQAAGTRGEGRGAGGWERGARDGRG